MSFQMYNNETDEICEAIDAELSHENKEHALVTFEPITDNQIRISFDLDHVRIHQLSDGDVIVTLKDG